uniref:SEFIR domain-containing protein n=1 Tax=Oryzias latipes TaxID=8090 RepID=A0A3P9K1Q1_ORYLA
MLVFGWGLFCMLLSLSKSVWSLEIHECDQNEVICLQNTNDAPTGSAEVLLCSGPALSDCTAYDEIPDAEVDTMDVVKLNSTFRLCCGKGPCALCLVIDATLYIPPDKDQEIDGQSGADEEEQNEENDKDSISVCYKDRASIGTCKKVEFKVNTKALDPRDQTEISMVISHHGGFPFSLQMDVKAKGFSQTVTTPSLQEVCSQEKLQKYLPACRGPNVTHVINHTMNWMELHIAGKSEDLSLLCVQYERDGICQRLKETTIPLESLAPCMCFQAWYDVEHESMRTLYCPFSDEDFPQDLQKNMHKKLTVDVHLRQVKDQNAMLFWNLSAPCRLKGEVQLCSESSCFRSNAATEQLTVKKWEQTKSQLWKIGGMFPDVKGTWNTSHCVQIKIEGTMHKFDPVCDNKAGRLRWSLLVVVSMLLICMTGFTIYFFHDFIKKWVQCYHRGKFVHIALQPKMGHVVLVSPPEVDDRVSESVRQLGLLLCQRGFSVSVDHWSRMDQSTLGPLPWLHSQMLKVDSMGGRCVLILTQETKERTQDWSQSNKVGNGPDQPRCPYSDLFYATLFLIQRHKQQNTASKHFTLVTLDSNLTQDKDRNLPELLCKLPLFHYPTQTGALLADLSLQERKNVRMWIWSRWRTQDV